MEYITAEEKELLEAELANRHQADSQITDRIAKARELGDLKENAEYHAAREDKGMNQAKIKMIEEKLATAVVADPADTDDEDLYKLVGESSGRFDMEYLEVTSGSNLGQSLFKAKVGETIRVDLPQGARTFEIVEILD
jgi:transcription elongation factor GreA